MLRAKDFGCIRVYAYCSEQRPKKKEKTEKKKEKKRSRYRADRIRSAAPRARGIIRAAHGFNTCENCKVATRESQMCTLYLALPRFTRDPARPQSEPP